MPSSDWFGRLVSCYVSPLLLLIMLTAVPMVSTPIGLATNFHTAVIPATGLITHALGNTHTSLPRPYALQPSATTLDSPNYDEQLGLSFTQSFSALAYDVTAVAQSDSNGYGPAYLLNGLTSAGYWYQVGLAWNWPYTSGNSYNPGFNMIYEVFDSNGNSIFPITGGSGMLSFSTPVNKGDMILLNLYFTPSDRIEMLASDQNTGAQARETYSAQGATSFIGTPSALSNSQGFFTGLMTEWYHVDPYYSDEHKVVYTVSGSGISSAWMWIDEFNAQNRQVLFSDSTPSPVSYANPTQLQKFSSNGANEYSDAYEFITGSTLELTLSYAIQGGGSGFLAPTLTYILNGIQQTATLTTFATTYDLDTDTLWNVTNPLTDSSSTERWTTNEQTSGNATSSLTINLVYYHQYNVSFSYNIIGGGTSYSAPKITYQNFGSQKTAVLNAYVWADAGGSYSYQNPLTSTASSERWFSNSTLQGTITQPSTFQILYYHQYYVTIEPNPSYGGTISPNSNWFDADASLQIAAYPNPGWQFEYWNGSGAGSYSGPTNATSIGVSSGITETANLYPGLTIKTSSETTVSYGYGSTEGTIPPNASQTVYIPPGTNITLTAKPSFFIYAFSRWSGAATSSKSKISVVLNTPLSLSSNHSYNYVNITLTMIGIVGAAIIILLVARTRRAKTNHHGNLPSTVNNSFM